MDAGFVWVYCAGAGNVSDVTQAHLHFNDLSEEKFIAECSTATEVCSGSDKCLEEYRAIGLVRTLGGATFASFSCASFTLLLSSS